VRVIIGEDEALLREGLTLVLHKGGFDVVATAADGDSLVTSALGHAPDLVVTDIRMPPDHTDEGLRAALRIRREAPETGIVVLSQHLNRRYAIELLEHQPGGTPPGGGTGYLLKQRIADIDAFHSDLRRVCAGETVLDSTVVALMAARARNHRGPMRALTGRQHEVLVLMAQGRSNSSIARTLSVSERAVIQHASHIYEQLDLPVSEDDHRRVLAVIRYLAGLTAA
jgi:DNA-binding NarL/FixJ family response regulator